MRQPDHQMGTTGCGGRALGEAAVQGKLNRANDMPHCPVDVALRRAESIRLHAIGRIGGA